MGDYFRGWRRKTGVVTLLMALVSVGGWVRSYALMDELWFTEDPSPTQIFIESCAGRLRLFYVACNQEITGGNIYFWRSGSFEPAYRNFSGWGNPIIFDWRWQFLGFDVGRGQEETSPPSVSKVSFMFIPYWSIVIPLTLHSAYLLLSKPRKSTPTKITEPIEDQLEV